MNKEALLIFTKNPVKGKCKTRLASTMGDDIALSIYKQLLAHTKAFCAKSNCDRHVYFSQSLPDDNFWDPSLFRHKLQCKGDLGQKMNDAFKQSFEEGYERVLIIGSDCAEINEKDLQKAFNALRENDVVIGPALDGGYYLLGMREHLPFLFENKSWSTPQLMDETIASLIKHNKSYQLLEKKSDIDYEEDLSRPGYINFTY